MPIPTARAAKIGGSDAATLPVASFTVKILLSGTSLKLRIAVGFSSINS